MSKKQSTLPSDNAIGRSPASRYLDEFKRDAVRLVSEEKYSFKAAAAAVNVSEKSLRAWHARFAPQPTPCGEDAGLDQLREENKRLRQQLKRAEMEREILKKATVYFAKESL
ncbi:MAG TPA: transposase [Pirellulales bacterium]|jgi:transposase|nr:transposase [Pirellulales bacterium]